jgi:hypothetical protein
MVNLTWAQRVYSWTRIAQGEYGEIPYGNNTIPEWEEAARRPQPKAKGGEPT